MRKNRSPDPLPPLNEAEKDQWTSAFKDHAQHIQNLNRMQNESAWAHLVEAAATITRVDLGPATEMDRLAAKRLLPVILEMCGGRSG